MGFLERAIRRGVSDAVGKAIGNAVTKAVEPTATELANKAAAHIDSATQSAARQTPRATSGLEGAFTNLERAAQGYATEAAKNMKICPNCEKPTASDKKFCPECGCALPEQTVAQGAVCTSCGTQNTIGTKFCQECGAKLPAAIEEDDRKARKDAAELARWEELLAPFPKWNCGGSEFNIEEYDPGNFVFSAGFDGNIAAAQRAVEQYRQLLLEHGFRQAGQYPCKEQLFKRIDGIVYNVDTEHCFEGDPDRASIGFCAREPYGGFDYVKPEPKKNRDIDLKDLKKFFKF
ncbi:MAG: zinc ribbon domain-containing protein [Ruminococcaceae bacterium]|nr:zinc ribbon domain-containing protein [Oscillospiraceae bacterium]